MAGDYPMPGPTTFSAPQERQMRAARAVLADKMQDQQDWSAGRNSAPSVAEVPAPSPASQNIVAEGE